MPLVEPPQASIRDHLLVVRTDETVAFLSKKATDAWWGSATDGPSHEISAIDESTKDSKEGGQVSAHADNAVSYLNELSDGGISVSWEETATHEVSKIGSNGWRH